MQNILRDGLDALGVEYTGASIENLIRFYRLLDERNRVMDLTAIRGEAEAARLHFLDCAALLKYVDPSGKRAVDVGTGAGFPGLPLKILRPETRLTLMDSLGKRIDFLREAAEALSLKDIELVCARAEETPFLREQFDLALARAVARLNLLCELCLPLVRPGGLFIAMKGADCAQETAEAENALRELGGRLLAVQSYAIPGTDTVHSAVIIEKVSSTPPKYPRRYARIKAKPL